MDGPYSGTPLNLQEKEIRLVKLEHSTPSSPIKCTLRSYTFNNECPAYIALSYTWGPSQRHADLELNNHVVPIGRNLWTFLAQMRSQHLYMTFWIDNLSIDQTNVLEQNHQVQMMRCIYTHAHSVWIWLGEADTATYSALAMQYLAAREPFGDKDVNYKTLWSRRKARAVLCLCERTYWTRIWIVQEIMLARKATILCGEQQVSWMKFQLLILDLQSISDRGRALHTIGVSDVLESPAAVIVRAKARWDASPRPLTTLLEQYRHQHATDIRDKVYALHGLASNSDGIAVDYRIGPKALLVEIIYHACSAQEDAQRSKKEILGFAKMLRDALSVVCAEEELDFHVSVARGDGIRLEKDFGLRVRGGMAEGECEVDVGRNPFPNLMTRREIRSRYAGLVGHEDDDDDDDGDFVPGSREYTDGNETVDDVRRHIVNVDRFNIRAVPPSAYLDLPENMARGSPTPSIPSRTSSSLLPLKMSMMTHTAQSPQRVTCLVDNFSVADPLDTLDSALVELARQDREVELEKDVKAIEGSADQESADADTSNVLPKVALSIPIRQVRFAPSEPSTPSEELEFPSRQPKSPPTLSGMNGKSHAARENFSAFHHLPTRKDSPADSATRYEKPSIIKALHSSGTILSKDDLDDGRPIPSDSIGTPNKYENLLQATIDQRLKHAAELQEVRESLEAATPFGDKPLVNKIQAVERELAARWEQSSAATLTYDCVFWFLNCAYTSTNAQDWKTHTLTHFNAKEPPTIFKCHLCPSHRHTTHKSDNGHDTWTHRLNHYLTAHARSGWSFITLPPPDMQLFQYLRDNTLITRQEYKTLVTTGWVEGTPRRYVESRVRQKKKGRKKDDEAIWALVRGVEDGRERHALRSVVKYLGLR